MVGECGEITLESRLIQPMTNASGSSTRMPTKDIPLGCGVLGGRRCVSIGRQVTSIKQIIRQIQLLCCHVRSVATRLPQYPDQPKFQPINQAKLPVKSLRQSHQASRALPRRPSRPPSRQRNLRDGLLSLRPQHHPFDLL